MMSFEIRTEEESSLENNILTSAFHANIANFAAAERVLAGKKPGSFMTYSIKEQNFCSAVGRDGKIIHNGFRLDASGYWQNFSLTTYATYLDLLDHLVDGQSPIPVYSS